MFPCLPWRRRCPGVQHCPARMLPNIRARPLGHARVVQVSRKTTPTKLGRRGALPSAPHQQSAHLRFPQRRDLGREGGLDRSITSAESPSPVDGAFTAGVKRNTRRISIAQAVPRRSWSRASLEDCFSFFANCSAPWQQPIHVLRSCPTIPSYASRPAR